MDPTADVLHLFVEIKEVIGSSFDGTIMMFVSVSEVLPIFKTLQV